MILAHRTLKIDFLITCSRCEESLLTMSCCPSFSRLRRWMATHLPLSREVLSSVTGANSSLPFIVIWSHAYSTRQQVRIIKNDLNSRLMSGSDSSPTLVWTHPSHPQTYNKQPYTIKSLYLIICNTSRPWSKLPMGKKLLSNFNWYFSWANDFISAYIRQSCRVNVVKL